MPTNMPGSARAGISAEDPGLTEDPGVHRPLCQVCNGGWGAGAGVGLAGGYAGVVKQGVDGGGGGVGEGGPDGGLVLFGPVEDLYVQGVDEGFDQVGGASVSWLVREGSSSSSAGCWSGVAMAWSWSSWAWMGAR